MCCRQGRQSRGATQWDLHWSWELRLTQEGNEEENLPNPIPAATLPPLHAATRGDHRRCYASGGEGGGEDLLPCVVSRGSRSEGATLDGDGGVDLAGGWHSQVLVVPIGRMGGVRAARAHRGYEWLRCLLQVCFLTSSLLMWSSLTDLIVAPLVLRHFSPSCLIPLVQLNVLSTGVVALLF